jgi:hypothetical protein
MILITEILKGLKESLETVCENVFLEPVNATDSQMNSFIEVTFPTSLTDNVEGSDDWWTDTIVQIDINVKDRMARKSPNASNPVVMDTLRAGVKNLIPLVIEGETLRYKVTRPMELLVNVSDGGGYHYTRIQAMVRTI